MNVSHPTRRERFPDHPGVLTEQSDRVLATIDPLGSSPVSRARDGVPHLRCIPVYDVGHSSREVLTGRMLSTTQTPSGSPHVETGTDQSLCRARAWGTKRLVAPKCEESGSWSPNVQCRLRSGVAVRYHSTSGHGSSALVGFSPVGLVRPHRPVHLGPPRGEPKEGQDDQGWFGEPLRLWDFPATGSVVFARQQLACSREATCQVARRLPSEGSPSS
jgi:hypothetical protein